MKTDRILNEVASELFGYLMSGELSRDELSAVVRPENLNSRYDDYESLVDLHFVLSSEVISFVEHLPQRLRELKTETRTTHTLTRGGIKGRIDWGKTYEQRLSQGNGGQSLYVSSRREESRETAENRLLRYVVEVVAQALQAAEPYFNSDTTWIDATWKQDRDLREEFLRLYETNVHLQALDPPPDEAVTDRMVRQAETARQPLYRNAAELYQHHRKRRRGDQDYFRQLIDDTTVVPDDEARLFELFVLFKTIRAVDSVSAEDPTLAPLVGNHTLRSLVPGRRGPAARFDGDREFNVFYDQSGAELEISFRVEPDREPVAYSRGDAASVYGNQTAAALFDRDRSVYTKRPDVLIAPEHPGDDPMGEYLIMEVKHTTKEDTIRQGIQELTQYLAFMRRDGDPVFETPGYQGCGINGVLVVKDVGEKILPFEEQTSLPITVLQASELDSRLPELLTELLRQ